MPDLKLYTIADLRNWLLHNTAVSGLSERIISLARAWAVINNPYVKDDDVVVAAILMENEVAAYTTAFPELINGKRYWWFSSLWCNPVFRGQGFGLIVIGSLAEVYGSDYILDRWGAADTVEIFTHFEHKTDYSLRHILGCKIDRRVTRGKFVYIVRSLQIMLHQLMARSTSQEAYSIRYLPYIDDNTYEFVRAHRKSDCFLHSQEMLNWVLQYSFTIPSPLAEYVESTTPFAPAETFNSQIYAVQVLVDGSIVGFYMMKQNVDCLHLLYLYYDEAMKPIVFASIREHVRRLKIAQFSTENIDLANYIRKWIYFPKYKKVDISFSYPDSFVHTKDMLMQYGDGDSFTQ